MATRRRRFVSAAVALALALPLAACATPTGGVRIDLRAAGCPDDIRIQTDGMPRVEWGFLYRLLDPHHYDLGADEVSGPLVAFGADTGVRLTILSRDADGVSANVDLYDDDSLLLAAVDTDRAMVDAVRYPTVGVFAPLAKDTRIVYWDGVVYPNVTSIEDLGQTLTPDATKVVPVVAPSQNLFDAYLLGKGLLREDQSVVAPPVDVASLIAAKGLVAQQGDALIDPYRLGLPEAYAHKIGSQSADATGYTRDAGVLSARRQTVVRYADCLTELVPLFQRSLVGYVNSPAVTTQLIVDLAAAYGDDGYPIDVATQAEQILRDARYVGNGRNAAAGDLDIGRVRGLIEDARPYLVKGGVDVPGGLQPEDLVTNRFIDRSVGF